MNGDSYRLKQSKRKRGPASSLNATQNTPSSPSPTRRGEYGVFRYAPDATLPAYSSSTDGSNGVLLPRRSGSLLLRP
jgi:hypothetical protein